MTLLKTEKGEDVGLPKGWIRETYSRTGKKKTYFVWIDPEKNSKRCHANMITAIIVIEPEGLKENMKDSSVAYLESLKRKIRYATSSRDGTVKIWKFERYW